MDIKKVFVLFIVTIFTLILLLGYHKNQQDDAYIFYTYAKNIAEGSGYVFNIGEKINATTSPLYTLLLAFLYFIAHIIFHGVEVPGIGEIINAAGIWFSAYSLFKLFMLFRKERLAILAPVFFITNPLIKHGTGMESFLMTALILWGLYYFLTNKNILSSVLLSLAVLTRFDAVLFLLVLFSFHYYKNKKLPPLNMILTMSIIISSWFIFSLFYFNELLPTTVYIKIFQSETGAFETGLIFLKGILRVFPGGAVVASLYLTALTCSVIFIFMRNRKILIYPLFLIITGWTLLHFLLYAFILNTPPYPWYYIPYILIFTLMFSAAADEIYILMNKKRIFFLIPVLVLITGLILPVKMIFSPYNYKYELYTASAEWLNKNAEDGSSVILDEIGIVGYYYRKGKIIDVFGLINPEAAAQLNKKNNSWALINYKPDYVIIDYPKGHIYLDINEDRIKSVYRKEIVINREAEVIIYKKIKNPEDS